MKTVTRTGVLLCGISLFAVNLGSAFAGVPSSLISGTKFEDVNGDGIREMGVDRPWDSSRPPVTIELRDQNGDVVDTTLTDSNGDYFFQVLLPGPDPAVYTVAERFDNFPVPGEVVPTTPTEQEVVVGVDGNPVVDFGNTIYGSIHGFKFLDSDGDGILDPNETGLAGVDFRLAGVDGMGNSVDRVETSAGDGNFWFLDVMPGIYTITELVPDGFLPTTPHEVTFALQSGQELVWQDGAAMLPPNSLKHEVNVGGALVWGNVPEDIPVPAPSILALFGIGLAGLGFAGRRSKV